MSYYTNLPTYKISIDPNSKKTQGLKVGDVVRRQYRASNNSNITVTTMVVMETGAEKVTVTEPVYNSDGSIKLGDDGYAVLQEVQRTSYYFVGALLGGTAPTTDQILDFVRITHLYDEDRMGALYLTASDSKAPYLDVIDGIGKNSSLCYPQKINDWDYDQPMALNAYNVILKGSDTAKYYEGYDDIARRLEGTSTTIFPPSLYLSLAEWDANINDTAILSFWISSTHALKKALIYMHIEDLSVDDDIGYGDDGISISALEKSQTFCVVALKPKYNGVQPHRYVSLNFTASSIKATVTISNLNIINYDALSSFSTNSFARIGKLDGIIDPIYGKLSGYGAYLPKLIASKSVAVAGTLTAGDENGIGATFYAGAIHKNCFLNSLDPSFENDVILANDAVDSPVGCGNIYKTNPQYATFFPQSNEWWEAHQGETYTFSCWIYLNAPLDIMFFVDGEELGEYMLGGCVSDGSTELNVWQRVSWTWKLGSKGETSFHCQLLIYEMKYYDDKFNDHTDWDGTYITGFQLEKGSYATAYQPTDGTLNYTDKYGVWGSEGGFGGTIQNPLLQLNYDGTGGIGTQSKSFLLAQDGSGYLANKNIQWDKDGKVTFGSDVTLNWDNLSDDAQSNLTAVTVKILGSDTFTVTKADDGTEAVSPSSITLELQEVGITSTSSQRKWYYQKGTTWIDLKSNGKSYTVYPDNAAFTTEGVATFKVEITVDSSHIYSDTFTIRKQNNIGYRVDIVSSVGNIFKNGECATVLTANVYYNGIKLDDLSSFEFTWHKYNTLTGVEIGLTEDEVSPEGQPNVLNVNVAIDEQVTYTCEVGSNGSEIFDYSFPITLA